jgi:hypothetical protein
VLCVCSCVSVSVGQWGQCGATGEPSACLSPRLLRSCRVGSLLRISLVRKLSNKMGSSQSLFSCIACLTWRIMLP